MLLELVPADPVGLIFCCVLDDLLLLARASNVASELLPLEEVELPLVLLTLLVVPVVAVDVLPLVPTLPSRLPSEPREFSEPSEPEYWLARFSSVDRLLLLVLLLLDVPLPDVPLVVVLPLDWTPGVWCACAASTRAEMMALCRAMAACIQLPGVPPWTLNEVAVL